jgi:predicted porin
LEKFAMKKTLIALAALASVSAFAQSSVNMTGALVMSVGNITEGAAPSKLTLARPTSNLTLSGSEDLGGGMKAGFVVQQGIYGYQTASERAATGINSRTVGNFGDRQAFLTLSAGFGTVKVGRDLNGGSQLVGYANVSGVNAVTGFDDSGKDAIWYGNIRSNSVSYQTPAMNGVSAYVGTTPVDYSGLTAGSASTTVTAGGDGIIAVATPASTSTIGDRPVEYGVTYAAGPLNAGLVVTDYKSTYKTTGIAANYDFGVAKVGIGYQTVKKAGDANTHGTIVSVTAPVSGALSVGAAYGIRSATADGAFSAVKTKQSMVGLNYALSKRTTVYLVANDKNSETAGSDWKETAVGIKHTF